MPLMPNTIIQQPSGLTLIAKSILQSADIFDFNNIPNSYNHLLLIMILRTTANSGANCNVVFNSDTGANYYRAKLQTVNTTVAGVGAGGETNANPSSLAIAGTTDTAGRSTTIRMFLPYYIGTTFHKNWIGESQSSLSTAASGQSASISHGTWADTSAITRIQVLPSTGSTFVAGSAVWLYGL